jgi:dihydropyrimidinase
LNVKRGAGSYVNRPAFAPFYDALQRQAEIKKPRPVDRS